MSTPNITSVSFNIKSADGGSRSYVLTKKNLIVGPNGSGKSAVVQAVALAVSGAAEEVAGRVITSDPALLMTLAHQHGHDGSVVFARANLSNGEHCQWETKRDENRIKTPTHIRPRWVIPHTSKQHSPHFPLREVREVLTGSAKKARQRFLAWVCSDLDEDVVEGAIHGDFETYKTLSENFEDLVPVDRLTHSIETADKMARKYRADAKAQAVLRNSLLDEVGVKPTQAKVLAARDAVREAQELHEANLQAAGSNESDKRRELLHSLLGQLRTEEQRLLSDMRDAETTFKKLRGLETTESRGSLGALHALEWAVELDADACPICSSEVGRAHVTACHGFYSDKVKDLDQKMTHKRQLESTLSHLDDSLTGTREQISSYEAELDELPASTPETNSVSVDETRDALSAAQANLASLQDALSKWETLSSARKLVEENGARAEKFSEYKRQAQKAVSQLLANQVDVFCEKVTAYLPDGWEFGVMVTDNGRDAFYYGLYEGSGIARYLKVGLSEAQRVTVTLAMCAVLDDMMPLPLSILAPEDRGWDADTLGGVMVSFKDIPQTVMLTSTVMPDAAYRKGWNVIDLRKSVPVAPARIPAPAMPTAAPAEAVVVTEAMPVLPETLRERCAPSSGRARGGKFRSLKRNVLMFIVDHGVETTRQVFRLAHPNLVVEDETSPEGLATVAANYLTPIGPQS
jgi:energy-coupling factor transporter ATP-binding protein EcfA2